MMSWLRSHRFHVTVPLAIFLAIVTAQVYHEWQLRRDVKVIGSATAEMLNTISPTPHLLPSDAPTAGRPITPQERALHENDLNKLADTERSLETSMQAELRDATTTADEASIRDRYQTLFAMGQTARTDCNREWERRRIEAGEIASSSPNPQ